MLKRTAVAAAVGSVAIFVMAGLAFGLRSWKWSARFWTEWPGETGHS